MPAVPALPAATRRAARRGWLGFLLSVATFLAAVTAALLAGPDGGLTVLGETISGSATDSIAGLTAGLPLGLAFGAGMVAAVNPCGFALLPGFLAVSMGREGEGRVASRLLRALAVTLVVSLSFVVLFGAAGLALSAAGALLTGALVWVGAGVGVLLIAAGGWVLSGADLSLGLGPRLAGGVGQATSRPGVAGSAAYGLAYGLASLGCALPPFLAVVGTAVGGPGHGVLQLVLYGIGLSVVFGVVTFAAAALELSLVARLRSVARYLPAAGAGLLLVSGAYVVYYWLTAGGALVQLAALAGGG